MKSKIKRTLRALNIKTSSLKFKIWSYLAFFSIIILAFLWFFQVIFLNLFYEKAKIRELNYAVLEIEKAYQNNSLYSSSDLIARDTGICIQIMIGRTITYDASSFNKGCVPETSNNTYKKLFLNSDKKTDTYKLINSRYNNEVLIKAIRLNDNTFVFISTSLEPLDAAITILTDQFIVVTLIVLLLSLLIGFFFSKKISKPIEKINQTALLMCDGNCNIKFDIDEDILELNQLVNTLNKTTKELSKTDELRRELMANVSHDLKTPLTMIKAYAEMVRDLTYNNEEKRNENLNIIIEETDRLNLLVNDILELSVLQSSTSVLNIEVFNLTEVIKSILRRYSILEKTNDYTFIFDTEDAIMVQADLLRIEQVIYNLLNNAVNYTGADKKVTIKINNVNKEYVKVSITDTGKGIKKEDMKLIWKKYYKVDKSHRRDKVGTGIGLSIVQNILMKHKFKYGVESVRGTGTTFWFEIKKDNA